MKRDVGSFYQTPAALLYNDDRASLPQVYVTLRSVVELFLANKAEVDARNRNGWTPLLCAADHGFKEIVELLLANKAGVNAKTEGDVTLSEPLLGIYQVRGGWTPYHMARARGHKEVAELLRQSGGQE